MSRIVNKYSNIEDFIELQEEVLNEINELLVDKCNYNINNLYYNIQDCLSSNCKQRNLVEINENMWDIIKKTAFNWGTKSQTIQFVKYYMEHVSDFYDLYNNLHDENSKETLLWLIKSNIIYTYIGDIYKFAYKMPESIIEINNDNFIPNYQSVYYIDEYKIYSGEQEMYDTWIREQYSLNDTCQPCKGDTVFSIGTFYGETAIWFSKKVGAEGMVFSFEASKENSEIAKFNILKNAIENVKIENQCLWSEKENVNFFENRGSSMVSDSDTGFIVSAITLDDYCESNGISKVDFVKMDVEGGELSVLKGAEKTIVNQKPKLAICVYHSPNDLIEIPKLIKKLVPEYKIFLSHKRTDFIETVLFAVT